MKFDSRVSDDPARFQELVSRLESLPGVEAAGGISRYFQVNAMHTAISIDGQPPIDSVPHAHDQLRRNRRPLPAGDRCCRCLRGRSFSAADSAEASQSGAGQPGVRRPLPSTHDPVGHVLRRDFDRTAYTIVGVVGNTRSAGHHQRANPRSALAADAAAVGNGIGGADTSPSAAPSSAVRQAIRDTAIPER